MIAKFNLFCLPHAGGIKYAYRRFVDLAPSFVKVTLLEYPGRGERIREAPIKDVVKLAELMVSEIKDDLDTPYAIYGHSMGTLVGYLMVREIRHAGYADPKFLFFTGSEGPSSRKKDKIRHLMSESDLIAELRSLGGISDEALNEPEILEYFLPIIRADFQAVETYEYGRSADLDIPINIAIGSDENVTAEEAGTWQVETKRPLELMQFSGNHFFIFEHMEQIMKLIINEIKKCFYAH
jgi:surfactin synthase thioesterase subunit